MDCRIPMKPAFSQLSRRRHRAALPGWYWAAPGSKTGQISRGWGLRNQGKRPPI
jgi:hypothetical protein